MLFVCNIIIYGQNANTILNRADSLSSEKNYDESISLLEKNIQLFENDNANVFLFYNRLGNNYFDIKDYENAKKWYLKYYQRRKPLLKNGVKNDIYWFSRNLKALTRTYNYLSDYRGAIAVSNENIEFIKSHTISFDNYESEIASLYGNTSWYYLLIKEFSSSEKAAKQALEIDGTKIWVKTNIAHSLLFQGKTAEAEKMYYDLAHTDYENNKTFSQTLLNDFDEFDKAGLVPQNMRNDFERIKSAIIVINKNINLENLRLSDKSDVTVTLNKDTLIFSGNGEMEDFLYQKTPWHERRKTIKHIIIKEGITSIGAYAFEDCDEIRTVGLSNTITKIGEGAFSGCKKINIIEIPNNVTTIGQYAFSHCENIESITIPKMVTSIDFGTFIGCRFLKDIYIPNSVKSIGEYAFRFCKNITTINIPEGVISIGNRAFEFCDNLVEATIPSSVTNMSEYAFHSSGLQYLFIDSANPRYSSVNNRALCSNDTLLIVIGNDDLTIPEGITTISRNSFQKVSKDFSEISSVTLSESVTSLDSFAFYGCRNLEYINIPQNVTNIGYAAFKGCINLKTVELPPNIETINIATFQNCSRLESIIIPESVRNIGDYAFENTRIKSIVIPNSDIHIGDGCFWGCDSLESIVFDKKSRYSFNDGLLSVADTLIICKHSKTGPVVIPENIKHIVRYAFVDCINITSVTIPSGVTQVAEGTFRNCVNMKSVLIPDGITHIKKQAFKDCINLTSVVIPNSVIYLGEEAFYSDSSLVSITLSDNLTEINKEAFNRCIKLPSIILPKKLETIGKRAFGSCENLSSVIFPDSLCEIYEDAFSYCKKLTSITIPENVYTIGGSAFYNCRDLKTIVNLSSIPQKISAYTIRNTISDSVDYKSITLYVPESSITSYQNADGWENFNIQPIRKNSKTLSSSIYEAEEAIKQAKLLHERKENEKVISLLLQKKAVFDKINSLSSFYGQLSWYYLFVKDFNKAKEAANTALAIDSSQLWIRLNLAHALLLQGQNDSANEIYSYLSSKIFIKKQTYCSLILEQLNEIENAGLLNSKNQRQVENTRAKVSALFDIEKQIIKSRSFFERNNFENVINTLEPLQNRFTEKNHFSTEALHLLGTSYCFYSSDYGVKNVNDIYLRSENCFLQLINNLDKTEMKYSKEYISALSFLGLIYLQSDFVNKDIDKSLDFYLQAIEVEDYLLEHKDKIEQIINEDYLFDNIIWRRKERYDRINVISIESNFIKMISKLFMIKGDSERYLEFYLNRLNHISKDSYNYPTYLNNIGTAYSTLGDYYNEEKYYIEAINSGNMDIKSTGYAIRLANLGSFYSRIGDYKKAEEYFIEAKIIFKANNVLANHPILFGYIISVFKNIGKIKELQEVYNEAESYFLFNYAETKSKRRENPGDYAKSLTALGNLYSYMNENEKAKDYFIEEKEIQEKIKGKEHDDYVSILIKLGILYTKTRDYAKAEKYYLEAITIQEKTIGKENPDYTNTMSGLSSLYKKNNDFEKVIKIEQDISNQAIEHINKNFSFLSEHQRNLYWTKIESGFENNYSLSYHHPDVSVNELNYNNTLFTKGLLLRTNNQIRDAIYDSGDELLQQQYEQLGSLRKQINVLQSAKLQDVNDLQTLTTRADSLDKALTQASAKLRELKSDMASTWQDVQKQLMIGEAAIEFVHFRLFDKKWTDTTMYAAMVLRPGIKSPMWIPICEQKELQSVLHMESIDTQSQTEILYTDKGKELYRLIWKKLEKELPGVKVIYYSPSGLFHKIAFNALPADKENVLLSDKYDLHLVSSTREIARLKKDIASIVIQDTTTVYGGLVYDSQQSAMLAVAKPNKNSANDDRFVNRFRKRDFELPDAGLRGGFSEWKYLTGTKVETEQIVKILSDNQLPYQYYSENKGNEESFKNLSGKKNDVIHLSTHGFFLPDIENEAIEGIVQQLGGNKAKPLENPLLRSGLIMSGANSQWIAKEYFLEDDEEDGILTAEEISRLNLTKTKLVVLSACETGLGDIKNSEGVFGLQRAFKLAGVESLIMSLWKVPDEATSELMSAFYNEWMGGKSRHASFKKAQQKVREKYHSPYYWAAFVMMD